jgi:hypothetical protein
MLCKLWRQATSKGQIKAGMKIEHQVCSLDLAKRLKELGVKQESLWWHNRIGDQYGIQLDRPSQDQDSQCWSAFTVAELGEMLPHGFYSRHGVKGYTCGELTQRAKTGRTFTGDTEADARANALIYLLEHKLIRNTP